MKYSILLNAIAASALVLLIASCCKKEEHEHSLSEFWNCRQQNQLDSAELLQELQGKWDWEFVSCYWTPDKANDREYKGLQIFFADPDSLELLQNGATVQVSKWKLIRADGSYFGIEADPPVLQMQGRILICDNKIVFNASYFDGCDQFFRKRK